MGAVRESLARPGQLMALAAYAPGDGQGGLEVVDGFKRLRAARTASRRVAGAQPEAGGPDRPARTLANEPRGLAVYRNGLVGPRAGAGFTSSKKLRTYCMAFMRVSTGPTPKPHFTFGWRRSMDTGQYQLALGSLGMGCGRPTITFESSSMPFFWSRLLMAGLDVRNAQHAALKRLWTSSSVTRPSRPVAVHGQSLARMVTVPAELLGPSEVALMASSWGGVEA